MAGCIFPCREAVIYPVYNVPAAESCVIFGNSLAFNYGVRTMFPVPFSNIAQVDGNICQPDRRRGGIGADFRARQN